MNVDDADAAIRQESPPGLKRLLIRNPADAGREWERTKSAKILWR